eukprot:1160789-Pelagomonas_calceolata.AAC.1
MHYKCCPQVQGNKKQLLPASEGSLNAQQAEEPSPQATEESPPRRSSERGHAARSSHSYSQLTFGIGSRQFLRSSSRPSIDQKRQELRRSMRNRTVSVNGTGRSCGRFSDVGLLQSAFAQSRHKWCHVLLDSPADTCWLANVAEHPCRKGHVHMLHSVIHPAHIGPSSS